MNNKYVIFTEDIFENNTRVIQSNKKYIINRSIFLDKLQHGYDKDEKPTVKKIKEELLELLDDNNNIFYLPFDNVSKNTKYIIHMEDMK